MAINDMPQSVLTAIKDYECAGELGGGAVKLKLIVTFAE